MGVLNKMGIRVLSGLIAFVLLVIVTLLDPGYLLIATFILSVIGIKELFKALELKGYKPFYMIGYMWVFILFLLLSIDVAVTFVAITSDGELFPIISVVTTFGFMLLLIFKKEMYNINDAALTIFAVIIVGYFFSFLPATRFMQGGQYLIWIIFMGAWVTDTCAYFTGVKFGKRKILPSLSPNKTLEGFIGGALGSLVTITLFGIYLNSIGVFQINVAHFIVIGASCGIISQMGDWFASAIKRYTGIKDFGNLMPGHGGVLDRFDSILVISPFVYFYFSFLL